MTKKELKFIFYALVIIVSGCSHSKESRMKKVNASPPKAEKIAKKLSSFGDTRIDYYYWLKERKNPKVIKYLKDENDYTDAITAPIKGLTEKIYEEMRSRIKEDDTTAPVKIDDYYYYRRYEKNKQYPIYCRKYKSTNAKEEVILDVNKLAKGNDFFAIGSVEVSTNHNILAYTADTVGRRIYSVYFKNLKTKKHLPDIIKQTTSNIKWANDNKTLFYTKQHPKTLRWEKIYRHELGNPKDTLVFFESEEIFDTLVTKTKTKKFLIIISHSRETSQCRYFSADSPTDTPKIFLPRQHKHEYDIDDGGDRFYIRTNWNAKNFRLMQTAYDKTTKENWKEVMPHRKNVLLEGFSVFKNYVALQERSGGLTRINVLARYTKKNHLITYTDPAYLTELDQNPRFDTLLLRYSYESLTTPYCVYDYNMKTGKKNLVKRHKVLGKFEPSDYKSERIFATSQDGTKIPISLVYKKNIKKDGSNPLFLLGYGAYGITLEPHFSSNYLSLLNRGFIYAIAHIRGGSQMGRYWYEQGRLKHKKNTFTDFIAVSEYLIKQKYTSPKHLYAYGASAGGLLIGAVINFKPELYNGVIAGVPFVDVLTTMQDDTIPLTTSEYEEWGNPHRKEYYHYIKSYSPYDNVKKQNYPNIFVFAGFHDSQVQYWEPAKWVAKLRCFKTDNNILLLKTEMNKGHSGSFARFKKLKEIAERYAFILDLERAWN